MVCTLPRWRSGRGKGVDAAASARYPAGSASMGRAVDSAVAALPRQPSRHASVCGACVCARVCGGGWGSPRTGAWCGWAGCSRR